jgi:hypothetical protein
MLAHTFLAVTAHKAKKRGPNTPNNQTDRIIRSYSPGSAVVGGAGVRVCGVSA